MGRAKIVKYYNDRWQGSLSDEDCDKLEQIIALDEAGGCFSDLRHVIYDLGDSGALQYIRDIETLGSTDISKESSLGTLTDLQTLGVAFMFISGNCILGDSVGLGKTIEVCGLVNLLSSVYKKQGKEFRYLLLTEKNLVEQTRSKMVRFTGEYAELLTGDAKAVSKFRSLHPFGANLPKGVVGSHSLLTQGKFIEWFELCRSNMLGEAPFDLLIVDESGVLGGLKSKITENAGILIPLFKRVVFLNATPFTSSLKTFYSQLNLLDSAMLPTKTNFDKEFVVFDYRGMYPRATNKYKNTDAFRRKVAYRYFARTRRDNGAVMENCSGKVLLSELSDIQKAWLSKTQMPQMVCDCPNAMDSTIAFNELNVPKLASLKEALEVDCADAQTILLFVHYTQAQESLSQWLTAYGYTNMVLNGKTKDADRSDIIRGFKNAEYRVLITNVQKGLDFGDCDYCIFYAFDPTPSSMVQFEGRITRSFDIVGKHIILLCSKGKELDRLNKVIKARAVASTAFTKADLSCVMDLLLNGEVG